MPTPAGVPAFRLVQTHRPRRVRGFTLIEVMIAVVLIGILASILTIIRVDVKRRVYIAQMRSDLRNLAIMQEVYYWDRGRYASALSQLNFNPTSTVHMEFVGQIDGWTARATHDAVQDVWCAYLVGNIPPSMSPADEEGKLTCAPKPGDVPGGGGGGPKK